MKCNNNKEKEGEVNTNYNKRDDKSVRAEFDSQQKFRAKLKWCRIPAEIL